MPDLGATDVSVALAHQDTDFLQFNKVIMPAITLGDGVKTVPAGGVPMPDLAHFGLHKEIARAFVVPNGDGRDYVFNRATHKLQMFTRIGGGLYTYSPGGGDIKGSANTDQALADQDAAPANGDLINTLHAVEAGPAWSYSENAEPDIARNVCITLEGKAVTGSVIPAGTYAITLTGLFRGSAQTDTITFTFAGVEGTIAAGKFRFKYGVKPFEKIANVAITPAHLANLPEGLIIGVGIGSKLGLPLDSLIGVEADILKITKNAADLAVSGTFSAANKTVNLGVLADGDDVSIQYQAASGTIELTGLVLPQTSLELMLIGQ